MGNLAHELSGEVDGVNLDEVMSSGDAPDIQMETAKPEPAPAAPVQTPAEFEFTANGKQIKVPATDPRVKQWMSQGYNYAQSMQQVNAERTEWQNKVQQAEQLSAKYKEIEEYQKKDPSWWDHVTQSYQQKMGKAADPNDPVMQKIQQLQQELEEVKGFKNEVLSEKVQKQREQEDDALTGQVKSMREQYSYLDWTTPDASGKSLELQVLQYASDNGISKFDAAFKAFKHDELLKLAESRGKESVVKDVQKKTKLGLLGSTEAPTKGLKPAENHKNKSYWDLAQEGLAELSGT